MRYRLGVIGFIGIAGLLMDTSLLACGDKFLVAGRGARFQRGIARATVLIYAPPASALSGELANLSVDSVLSRAGYRPSTAASAEKLTEILKDKRPDVVVVDIADARTVEKHAPAGSSGPIILPVLNKPSRQEIAEARRTWGVVLKTPASGDSLLDALDEAVGLHAKARKSVDPKP
jgi:hypothetical protein